MERQGYRVLNPTRHGPDPGRTWLDYMRVSLVDLAAADGVVLLTGWEESRGARVEQQVAVALGLPCDEVWVWWVRPPIPPSPDHANARSAP